MKLLMLTPYFPPHVGGVEQHVLRVSQELAARGHFVRVLTLRHAPDLPRHEEMGPLEVFRTPRSRLARAVGLRLRLLREADIVHCHDAYAFRRFVGPMRLLSGRPIFITFHGYEGYPIAAGAIRLRQAIAGKVRGSICMGEFICRHYHTRCDHISYGGVDMPEPPAPPPSPSGGAVFIGRLEPDTAIETYLEALRIARDEHGVRLDLEVCGDGSLRPALERYAAEHALSVLFRGAVADVRPALTRARFAFVTGYLAIWQAMAFRRLVFAVYRDPLRRDYLTLFPSADEVMVIAASAEELAVKVAHHQHHYELVDARTAAACELARANPWSRVADLYLRLYRDKGAA